MIAEIAIAGTTEPTSTMAYAIIALICTTVVGLVTQVLTYLKASKSEAQSAAAKETAIEIKKDVKAADEKLDKVHYIVNHDLVQRLEKLEVYRKETATAAFEAGSKKEKEIGESKAAAVTSAIVAVTGAAAEKALTTEYANGKKDHKK